MGARSLTGDALGEPEDDLLLPEEDRVLLTGEGFALEDGDLF